MVRAKWEGTLAAALLGTGLALGQTPDASTLTSRTATDAIVIIQEPNQPKQRCKLIRSWREANGATAYELQVLSTGEKMTIVQAVSGVEPPQATPEVKKAEPIQTAPAHAVTPLVTTAPRAQSQPNKLASTYALIPLPGAAQSSKLTSMVYTDAANAQRPQPRSSSVSYQEPPIVAPSTTPAGNDWRRSWGKADDHITAGLPHADTQRADPLKSVDYFESNNKEVPSYLKYDGPPSEGAPASIMEEVSAHRQVPISTTEEVPAHRQGPGGLLGLWRDKRSEGKNTGEMAQDHLVAGGAIEHSPMNSSSATSIDSEASPKGGLIGRMISSRTIVSPADAAALGVKEAESGNAFSPPSYATTQRGTGIFGRTNSPETQANAYQAGIATQGISAVNSVSHPTHVMPDSQQLIAMLHDAPYPSQREWAAETLATAGWQANPYIVPALLRSAREDQAATVRATSIRCLGRMNVHTSLVIGSLEMLKNDADARVRQEVASSLAILLPTQGPGGMPALQPAGAFNPEMSK